MGLLSSLALLSTIPVSAATSTSEGYSQGAGGSSTGTSTSVSTGTSTNYGTSTNSGTSHGTSTNTDASYGASEGVSVAGHNEKGDYSYSYTTDLTSFGASANINMKIILLGINNLNVNGTEGHTILQATPYIKDKTTMVPVRVISEGLKASVKWDAKAQKITISNTETTIVLTIGSKTALVNGKEAKLDVSPEIKKGNTFIPLRFIAQSLKAEVSWDVDNQIVTITQ